MNQQWWLNNQLYQLLDMCEFWYEMALRNPEKARYYFGRAKFYNLLKQSIEEQMKTSIAPVLFNHMTQVIYEKIRQKWPN